MDRKDGKSAETNPAIVGKSKTAKGTETTERLEKIILFSKSKPGVPLQTTHFEYDYTLIPNTPNSEAGGRLTLKALWFENEGVVQSKIAPYQFKYEYKEWQNTDKSWLIQNTDITTNYANVLLYGNDYKGLENPAYSHNLDCWGNYQSEDEVNGQRYNRNSLMRSWVNQNPTVKYDPACWNLKQIILPSGGEIHIQYEQSDYAYVQDRKASAMVSIKKISNQDNKFQTPFGN